MASKRDVPAEGGLYRGERFYWPSGFQPFAVKNGSFAPSLCPNATLCKFVAKGTAGDFLTEADMEEEGGPVMCDPKSAKPEFCPGALPNDAIIRCCILLGA